MAYEQIIEPNGIYTLYTGTVTAEEIIEADNKYMANQKFKNDKYLIADFTNADVIDITNATVSKVGYNSKIFSLWNTKLIAAIVVRKEHEQLAEKWENIVKNIGITWQIKIFNNVEEAREWIDSSLK